MGLWAKYFGPSVVYVGLWLRIEENKAQNGITCSQNDSSDLFYVSKIF